MPIVLLNFPTTILKAYIVESIDSESNHTKTTHRFEITDDDVLTERDRAIQTLLSEKKRLTAEPDNDNRLINHIRFYLEYIETQYPPYQPHP